MGSPKLFGRENQSQFSLQIFLSNVMRFPETASQIHGFGGGGIMLSTKHSTFPDHGFLEIL